MVITMVYFVVALATGWLRLGLPCLPFSSSFHSLQTSVAWDWQECTIAPTLLYWLEEARIRLPRRSKVGCWLCRLLTISMILKPVVIWDDSKRQAKFELLFGSPVRGVEVTRDRHDD